MTSEDNISNEHFKLYNNIRKKEDKIKELKKESSFTLAPYLSILGGSTLLMLSIYNPVNDPDSSINLLGAAFGGIYTLVGSFGIYQDIRPNKQKKKQMQSLEEEIFALKSTQEYKYLNEKGLINID